MFVQKLSTDNRIAMNFLVWHEISKLCFGWIGVGVVIIRFNYYNCLLSQPYLKRSLTSQTLLISRLRRFLLHKVFYAP